MKTNRMWEMFKRRVRDERTYADIAREFNVSSPNVSTRVQQVFHLLDNYRDTGSIRVKCRGKVGENSI
jgi:DNA-directed RNA polymerase specialized sigma24 family protein